MNGYKKDYGLEKKFFQFTDMRELMEHSAKKYKDKVAFITKTRRKPEPEYKNTTYMEMYKEMEALGTALLERGLRGEQVAIVGENSYQWVLADMAIACGVGTVVPLDKALQKDELLSCLKRSHAKAVFYDKKHVDMIREILSEGSSELEYAFAMDGAELIQGSDPDDGALSDERPDGMPGSKYASVETLIAEGASSVAAGNKEYLGTPVDPDKMSYLLFTSGTTEQSKAVMLSHRNLMSCNYGMNCEELFFPDDVDMMILPLHHIYGFMGLVTFLSQGLTTCFTDGLKYISKNMQEYHVSVMMSVPLLLENMYKKINKAIEKQGKTKKVQMGLKICDIADKAGINLRRIVFKQIIDEMGGKMRFFINGAAALDPVVQKGLNDLGILTVQGYGLTETSPTIASETYRYVKKGSCGKVMPNVKAMIADPDDEGIGELVVKGDNVMLGYYDNPEATEEVMEGGWFHTGDLAYFDEEGYLFITGRKKNVIVMKNGKNVFPEEIENLINFLPYVSESMVFTQNKANDYVLWVKVVMDQEYMREQKLTKEDVEALFDKDLAKINEDMPAYKMVKHFFLSDRPTIKTTTMKTKRREEIKQIEEELKELNNAAQEER